MRLAVASLALAAAVGLPAGTGAAAPHLPFCPPAPRLAACAAARLSRPIPWKGGYEPLDRVLRAVARRAFVPASIVLARPIPKVELPRGRLAPATLLDGVVHACTSCRWEIERGVLLFFDARVRTDPQNFLNWRIGAFAIGPDVGDDMRRLHQMLGRWPSRPLMGMALAGPDVPIVGRPCPAALTAVAGRTVLLRLLAAAPSFYSQIIFPGGPPLTHKQALDAIANWRWVPLTQPPIQPPPPPCGPYQVPAGAPPGWTPPPGTPCHPGAPPH